MITITRQNPSTFPSISSSLVNTSTKTLILSSTPSHCLSILKRTAVLKNFKLSLSVPKGPLPASSKEHFLCLANVPFQIVECCLTFSSLLQGVQELASHFCKFMLSTFKYIHLLSFLMHHQMKLKTQYIRVYFFKKR